MIQMQVVNLEPDQEAQFELRNGDVIAVIGVVELAGLAHVIYVDAEGYLHQLPCWAVRLLWPSRRDRAGRYPLR